MTGSGLWNFLIAIVGLIIVGALFFLGIDYIAKDEKLKTIAKWAVGGILTIILLVAVGGLLFGTGGAGGLVVTPAGVIQFAIALIVALLFLFLVEAGVNYLAPEALKAPIIYVVSGVVLIALLVVAGTVLTGGNLSSVTNLVGARGR